MRSINRNKILDQGENRQKCRTRVRVVIDRHAVDMGDREFFLNPKPNRISRIYRRRQHDVNENYYITATADSCSNEGKLNGHISIILR